MLEELAKILQYILISSQINIFDVFSESRMFTVRKQPTHIMFLKVFYDPLTLPQGGGTRQERFVREQSVELISPKSKTEVVEHNVMK